jgi:hypothetical protein
MAGRGSICLRSERHGYKGVVYGSIRQALGTWELSATRRTWNPSKRETDTLRELYDKILKKYPITVFFCTIAFLVQPKNGIIDSIFMESKLRLGDGF